MHHKCKMKKYEKYKQILLHYIYHNKKKKTINVAIRDQEMRRRKQKEVIKQKIQTCSIYDLLLFWCRLVYFIITVNLKPWTLSVDWYILF